MSTQSNTRRHDAHYQVALVLQGGGALGAYHIGAYQALHEAGYEPEWVSGISIGAVNAALIVGNQPDARLGKLTKLLGRDLPARRLGGDVRRRSPQVVQLGQRHGGGPLRPAAVLFPAVPEPLSCPPGHARRHELLRYEPAAQHAGAAGGFRPDQFRARPPEPRCDPGEDR